MGLYHKLIDDLPLHIPETFRAKRFYVFFFVRTSITNTLDRLEMFLIKIFNLPNNVPCHDSTNVQYDQFELSSGAD